jgi:pimeloyl-ACP methyl ester carboxylesterase
MTSLPGWRYFRNLFLLMTVVGGSLAAAALAFSAPLHWLWALPLYYLAFLFWNAFLCTHPRRLRFWGASDDPFTSPGYEKTLIPTQDGLTLFGWYRPGARRAAVIMAHGLGGAGFVMEIYAEFLGRAGYGVLLLDLRAYGSSDGDTCTYGVLEAYDIAGAVDFLLSRGEVDAGKIGLLGVSLGAQAGLRGALLRPQLGALVLEGLGPADIRDRLRPLPMGERSGWWVRLRRKLRYCLARMQQWAFNFFSGYSPTPLVEEIGKLASRSILLIACGKYEIEFNRWLAAAAQGSCEVWELPQARHAAALDAAPHEYARRVLDFFEQALE